MKLTKGSTIAIISPSGPVENREEFLLNIKFLRSYGFRVKIFPHALDKSGFLAGSDEARLEDLHSAFLDDEVDAILCSRGGYGAIRLLDNIDYSLVARNKKIFIGSSDITALLITMYKRAGLEGYHAPMLMNGFASDKLPEFLNIINGQTTDFSAKIQTKGAAQGILWGGNLSTLVSLFGSDDYIPCEDIILFLEDINEPLYKTDRMLMQIYRNSFLRDKIKGIAFGEFSGINKEETSALQDVLLCFEKMFDVPCVYGFSISHNKNNTVIPFGKKAKLIGAKICLL